MDFDENSLTHIECTAYSTHVNPVDDHNTPILILYLKGYFGAFTVR